MRGRRSVGKGANREAWKVARDSLENGRIQDGGAEIESKEKRVSKGLKVGKRHFISLSSKT